MISLLVVDDEPIEREAIRLLVVNNLSDIEIVGEAGNGVEALRIARLTKPDIIMIDINMPGMSGLECIECISKEKIDTKFIIVTSYSSFDFAQQAIKLGVYDFLVKPVEIDVIRKTFKKVTDEIYRERMNSSINKELVEKVDSLNPVVEVNILKSLLNKDPEADFHYLFSLLSLSPGYCCVFLLRCPPEKKIEYDRISRKLKQLGFISLIYPKDAITALGIMIEEKGKERSLLQDKLSFVSDCIGSFRESGWHWAMGDWVSDVKNITVSYDQARKCLKYAIRNNLEVCSVDDISDEVNLDSYEISYVVKELTRLILQQSRSSLLEFFDETFEKMKLQDKPMLSKNSFYILLLVKQKLSEIITNYSIGNEEFSSSNIPTPHASEQMIRQWMHHELTDLLQKIELARDSQKSTLYQLALEYIQTNFYKSIDLEDVASTLGITASYVSKLIRKNAGKSFSEILTTMRLEKAKQLLSDTSLSVKEITFNVGFNSQHYFARLFKKHVGCSPTDYRKIGT